MHKDFLLKTSSYVKLECRLPLAPEITWIHLNRTPVKWRNS